MLIFAVKNTSGFGSADDFNNDHLKFDATLMNFLMIGEMAGKLSEDFKNGISDIDWVKLKDSETLWESIIIFAIKHECRYFYP